ncbi:hypothetical protein OC846_003264 [Tilletia horrida]|uniref:Uncharacterized protein n=1 Tax=Tilletia horrida TaxID=155126 RepID=A0AAN6GPS3_9BASI|nr:hypothetical protein OC846_003264 [Tilletia horrida]
MDGVLEHRTSSSSDVSNADLGDCKAVLLADLTTAPLTNIGNEYSTNDGDLDAIRALRSQAFLNRFENGAEEKVLLLTILAEEIMHAPTASASLARGAQLQSGAKLHDRAYRILANQRMDSDSVIVNSQSLVLQAFRKLLRGEIKLAICMFILCQSATLWLLQDRQEHPQPPLLINGVDLTALDNELLTNTYWLSRAASQLLLLRIGLPLTSTLLAAGPSDIALIPSLPPCRPNATLLYHLEQTSGNYRMLPAHSRAIASLKLTSHISEVVCLLNAKFQTLATMPNAGPDIAPLREATHMEAITSEFPNTILDILCSLDSEVTDEHPEVLHMLRDIMVHLAFPRADVIASRSGFGPTSTGIHALNHLLMVIISAVASLSSTEQTPPLKSTISENAGDMPRILLDLEFRSDHLGRSALLAARLFDSAIRALEIVLFHCQLLPMPLADERQVSMFRLTSEATIFVLQRQGQILHLLQQMYSVLQQDRMICGPRRSTERRVKQLVQVLEDRGIIAVPAHRAAQGAGSETSSRPQTSQTRSSENDSQGSSQNSSQSSLFSEVGHQLQIVDEPVAPFGVPSQARTLSQWPATLIPAQNSVSLGPARWQHRSWSELPHTPSNGGFLAGPSAASQVLPTQSVSMSLPTTPWASTGPTWSNWSLPPGFPTYLQQPSPITLAPAQSPTVDAVPDFSLAAGKSASGI